MIKCIVFDIDGTLIDTQQAILISLQQTVVELTGNIIPINTLHFALGIPGKVALEQLKIQDIEKAELVWAHYFKEYASSICLFDGIERTLALLQQQGYQLGIITSKTREEYLHDFIPFNLSQYFTWVVCVEDTSLPKPHPDPMCKLLELSGFQPHETLYIGDTAYDQRCAYSAHTLFGLAVWGCANPTGIKADFYFSTPLDIYYTLTKVTDATTHQLHWMKFAMELQFLAQGGITYSKDEFDKERFTRIREIAAEMMSKGSGYSVEFVKDVFCNEVGFQTPKLDTRAAIFKDDKILLVKEKNATWSLPGGWVDVNESIKSNTIKEVKEEAGLDVIATKLIAVQDRNLHNTPPYAYGITKAFVLCEMIGGEFESNQETTESNYFSLDELPLLAEEKNTAQQIKLCFEAYHADHWITLFD